MYKLLLLNYFAEQIFTCQSKFVSKVQITNTNKKHLACCTGSTELFGMKNILWISQEGKQGNITVYTIFNNWV